MHTTIYFIFTIHSPAFVTYRLKRNMEAVSLDPKGNYSKLTRNCIIVVVCGCLLYWLFVVYSQKCRWGPGFVDKHGNPVDICLFERTEQYIANTFIEPDNVVLELGARYGTVSCVINKRLSNPLNQVSVEPDKNVWHALQKNRERNGCSFHILQGFISDKPMTLDKSSYSGMGVSSPTSDIPCYSLASVEKHFGLKFDTLVVDCEGCLETFLYRK
jgi:FkbM family methyltransferase